MGGPRPLPVSGLNSPDSPVFKKGAVLFGLHEARDQLANGAVPVLVEGPTLGRAQVGLVTTCWTWPMADRTRKARAISMMP